DKRVRLQRPSGPPIVHGPILVEIVIGLLDNRIDTIKSLEEITLACLVLPDKSRDLIGVDPTRINHIAEVRYLKPFEFHFSPPLIDQTTQQDRADRSFRPWRTLHTLHSTHIRSAALRASCRMRTSSLLH